jgi:hypothetical protein
LNRKKMVLDFIDAHPLCTKTNVKNSMPFAPGTTDKILKELIEVDEKVVCYIDKVNPRTHHLLIPDKGRSAMVNNSLLRATSVQLMTGERISFPHNLNCKFPIIDASVLDEVKKLIAGTKWF